MQEMVKDFNYRYDVYNEIYVLFYIGDDFQIHTYKTYSWSKYGMSAILLDIHELTTLGFRYNPYLANNNR